MLVWVVKAMNLQIGMFCTTWRNKREKMFPLPNYLNCHSKKYLLWFFFKLEYLSEVNYIKILHSYSYFHFFFLRTKHTNRVIGLFSLETNHHHHMICPLNYNTSLHPKPDNASLRRVGWVSHSYLFFKCCFRNVALRVRELIQQSNKL